MRGNPVLWGSLASLELRRRRLRPVGYDSVSVSDYDYDYESDSRWTLRL